jgi:hypothetical protein
MKLSRIGRIWMAFVVSVAMGLGMTACGGGTIGYLWVLGTQYNQIAGFKIDNFSGNLTQIPKAPFSSGGTNPVSIVKRPGGRYVYVINQGNSTTAGNIAEFSVGGDGVLTFQASYNSTGSIPVWAATDSSGNFLYVLDQQAKDAVCSGPAVTATSCYGSITVFAIAADTGRLQLVPNQQVKDANNTQLTYFPVGLKPTMLRLSGGGCLFTMDTGDNTIFPYNLGSNGQLTLTTNSTITTGATKLTSINTSGGNVYLTDTGSTVNGPGQILPYTVGSGCALNTLTGGAVPNLPAASNPVYSLTDSQGKFLYVLNQSTTNSNAAAGSSISAFTIDPTSSKLSPIPLGGTSNPYPVGSGPVCMVEDPSSQYVYTSNHVDGTVTGKQINKSTGELTDLQHGSTFPATGLATCLEVSGNVN